MLRRDMGKKLATAEMMGKMWLCKMAVEPVPIARKDGMT